MLGSKTLILTSTYPSDLSPSPNNHHRRLRHRLVSALHVVGLLASLIAISLFAAAIPSWNKNFFHTTGPNRGDWTDGISLGPLTVAALYHGIVSVQARVQKAQRSGVSTDHGTSLSRSSLIVHTAVPCLILLSLLPALLIATYGSLFRFWRPAVRTQSGILICNMLNIFARECEPTLYDIGNLQIAGITFGTLVWITHFALLLVSLRNMRRSMLAKQLQQEKIAQYAGSERRSSSRSSRRGYGTPRGSTSSHGAGDHGAWHQQPRRDRSRRSGSGSSSNSNPGSRSASGSRSSSLVGGTVEGQRGGAGNTSRGEESRQIQQELPIVFIQPPEESHQPTSRRTG